MATKKTTAAKAIAQVVGTVHCTEIYLAKKCGASTVVGEEVAYTYNFGDKSFTATGAPKSKVWNVTGDVALLKDVFATNFTPAGQEPNKLTKQEAKPNKKGEAAAEEIVTTAPTKKVAKVKQEAAPVVEAASAKKDKKATPAPVKETEVAVAKPVATAKRTAVTDTEAILKNLSAILGHKGLKKMEVKCGKGTVAVKIKEEGKPTRNVLTLNEIYQLSDGKLVMALNLNSLATADVKLPKDVKRKDHKGYFKHSGLSVETVAEIVKLNW